MKKNLGFIALFLILYFAVQAYQNRGLIGQSPPVIQGKTVSGQNFDPARFKGRVSVIYFWATWCPICEAMQSNIKAIASDHPLISFAMQSGNQAEVLEYLNEQKFDIEVLLDEQGSMAQHFGLRGVPAVFILDQQGEIRFAMTGYSTEYGLRFRLWLAGL